MARAIGITSGYYGDTTNDHFESGSGTNYIPQLYAKKALRNFYAQCFYKDICNVDYEG